ncbi:MAG: hypothetical protein OXE41_05055 [Gammaproteobacteria bacterium]|nr:hypothetical protein [Gammaproteobacteria bacterium]MCY4219251.1 hypothetical protein [Gammaproteobacteria bacterium]MCY4274747.1 hypothetical protein [Gammaproteobacteria bacterium]
MNSKTQPSNLRSKLDQILINAHSFAQPNLSDAVLFMGQPTDPIPRALIQDRDLPPWARILWCYFRQLSDSPATAGAMANYETISEQLGIGGRGTISDAIHALRITRWVTLIPKNWKNAKMDNRNVFLLHNIPITYTQAMELDPKYADLLVETADSPRKKLRDLARRMIGGTTTSTDTESPLHEINRLAGYSIASSEPSSQWLHIYERLPDQDEQSMQYIGPKHEQNSEMEPLDFHETILDLSPGQVVLMRNKLMQLEAGYRQAYLDELAVRHLEGKQNNTPLRNASAYLMWQVNEHNVGNITLTGKGERLQTILQEQEKQIQQAQKAKYVEKLNDLGGRLEHVKRLLEFSAARNKNPEPWMLEDKQNLEQEIRELRQQFHAKK